MEVYNLVFTEPNNKTLNSQCRQKRITKGNGHQTRRTKGCWREGTELRRIVSIATNHIRSEPIVGSSVFLKTTPSRGDHSLLPQSVPTLWD